LFISHVEARCKLDKSVSNNIAPSASVVEFYKYRNAD